jgi:hypothetical protein
LHEDEYRMDTPFSLALRWAKPLSARL